MTFSDTVRLLRRSGRYARRKQWPDWRRINVERSGKGGSNGIRITLNPKLSTEELSDGSHPDVRSVGNGKIQGRWAPLFRDLIASDWEVFEFDSSTKRPLSADDQ